MKNVMLITGLATIIAFAGPDRGTAASHKDGMHAGGMHGSMQMRPGFDEIDADGDGKITTEEMTMHMQSRFDGADSDGDDVISREELVRHMMARQTERMGQRADHMIERYDSDGDGALSMQEMRDRRSGRMMKRMDLDGDGAVSRAEFETGHGRHGDRHHGMKDRSADQ